MPVNYCGNNRWRIGDGECIYRSEAAAERAYVAYLAEEEDEDHEVRVKNWHFHPHTTFGSI